MSVDAVTRSRVEARLADLRAEHARGSARLAELEAEAERHRQTLLRIAGAVQVLTEMLATDDAGGAGT